jgi:Icc-related predicted phosphoesterase
MGWYVGGALVVCVFATGATKCGDLNEQGYLRASVRGDMAFAGVERGPWDLALDEACGSAGLTDAGRATLDRWPYLQKVTDTSAEILWSAAVTGETADEIRVELSNPDGTSIGSVHALADPDGDARTGLQYVAQLEGLPTNAIVCYRIVGPDGTWVEPTGFRTAPAPGSDQPVRFVALGDLGKRTSDQFAVLQQIETVEVDLALITGDLAYDNGELGELEDNFFGVYRELMAQVPFFVASGNHEYNTDDAAPFRRVFSLFENGGPEGTERWYSFDWGSVHFVVLDTEQVGDTQVKWLDEDLAANDLPFTVAVAHRPPYSSGHHGSERHVRKAFSPVFERHGVQLVLLGHEHDYERTKDLDGVTYVVAGGGGRGTRPVGESDFTAVSDRVAHFVYVEADSDGMRLVAIDATGQEFDSWATKR